MIFCVSSAALCNQKRIINSKEYHLHHNYSKSKLSKINIFLSFPPSPEQLCGFLWMSTASPHNYSLIYPTHLLLLHKVKTPSVRSIPQAQQTDTTLIIISATCWSCLCSLTPWNYLFLTETCLLVEPSLLWTPSTKSSTYIIKSHPFWKSMIFCLVSMPLQETEGIIL